MRILKSLIIIIFLLTSQAYASSKPYEYYYTNTDQCLISNMPQAFGIGNDIANGAPLLNKYGFILDSKEFFDDFFAEPLDLSYAFFLIAKRIGDKRSQSKIKWINPYVSEDRKEIITSIIYRKFSNSYLRQCFADSNTQNNSKTLKNDNMGKFDTMYELYMYQGY